MQLIIDLAILALLLYSVYDNWLTRKTVEEFEKSPLDVVTALVTRVEEAEENLVDFTHQVTSTLDNLRQKVDAALPTKKGKNIA